MQAPKRKVQGSNEALASDYVKGGMIRFINSKYASRLHEGGMIGYVMDGNTASATKSVDRNVKRQQVKLKMKASGLNDSSILAVGNPIKETAHDLGKRRFIIYHIFLPR